VSRKNARIPPLGGIGLVVFDILGYRIG
jgi:hypothetical protein